MRPADDIHKKIKNLNLKASADLDNRIHNQIDNALANKQNKSSVEQLSIWRIIMKTKTARFATAAIFVIAILLSITVFDKPVSQAFAMDDIIKAMNNSEWMHLTVEVTDINGDPEIVRRTKGTNEIWQSIDPARTIIKSPGGEVKFAEPDSGKLSEYDPQSNTITTTLTSPQKIEQPGVNMGETLLKQIEQVKEMGAVVTYSDARHNGSDVLVINVDYTAPAPQNVHIIMSLWVEEGTNLPLKVTAEQSTEQISGAVMTGTFSYPKSGPTDIYQVGVPRDAEIKIIDYRPDPDTVEALKPYNAARDSIADKYIMIVTHLNTGSKTERVTATYNDGRKQRHENHFIFGPGDALYKMWPVYAAQMGDSFDSLLEWSQQQKSSQAWIYLYDGKYSYRSERDIAGIWTKKDKQYYPQRNPNPSGGLDSKGWPLIGITAKIVSNEYSVANGFICVETICKAQIKDGKLWYPAQKSLYYIDPERDYICIRKDTFWYKDYANNPEVDQLDFDPETIPDRPTSRTEITEFTKTDAGRWYPAKFERSSIKYGEDGSELPSRPHGVEKIYLVTDHELPEGVFDPENITTEDTQAGTGQIKQTYEDAFDKAIEKIDSQSDWPEPAQITIDYWNARAKKDYDKCAILWPGSTTWNEKLLADEQAIEYVFSEPNQHGEGYAIVPYASKAYYEKHQEYNLKMHLTNEKSVKGRYYIISGN